MTKVSRKKIRGFKRKLKQIDQWKNAIVLYPFGQLNFSRGKIFRIHAKHLNWGDDINPNSKFYKYFYTAFFDILQNLKKNEILSKNEMTIQLWVFYPRVLQSLILIAPVDLYKKRNEMIGASETKTNPPKLIRQMFKNFSLKIGADNVFESSEPKNENAKWITHKLGDIWTVD